MEQLAEFIGNHIWLSLAFLVTFFLYIMLFMSEKMQAFASVNTSQLTQLVNHKDAIVIDTRTADNFQSGHIVNAVNIPLADLVTGKASLDQYKGKNVITYCRSGMTSKTACKHLIKSGVENVFNLSGGINGWINEKLPLVKK